MNINSKRLGIYSIVMLVCTAIAVTLRTIACLTELNDGTGYFAHNSLTGISNPIIFTVVIASFSYIFVASRTNLTPSFSTAATYVPTGILGVSTLFLGARTISKVGCLIPISPSSPNPANALIFVAFVLSLISIGYFFFNVYTTESRTEIRAAFAVGIIAFFAVYAMMIYFDGSLPINNPGKILNQTVYLFAALFFLYEARISLGREMWRIYSAFAMATAALAAYSSVPALIAYYVKGYVVFGTQRGAFTSIEEYMLTFALFIYAVAKLVITITAREKSENKYANAVAAFAAAREAEVEDSLHRFNEDFASKQLSIFELYGEAEVEITEEETENEDEVLGEEPEKIVMISDDAIYESIFGKMPEKEPYEEIEAETNEQDAEATDDTESIVENLLTALENSKTPQTPTDKDENEE